MWVLAVFEYRGDGNKPSCIAARIFVAAQHRRALSWECFHIPIVVGWIQAVAGRHDLGLPIEHDAQLTVYERLPDQRGSGACPERREADAS